MMDPFSVVILMIFIILISFAGKIFSFVMRIVFAVLIITFFFVLIFGVSINDVLNWGINLISWVF